MPDGTIIKRRVIYEYKPRYCSICCIPGHTINVCQKLNLGAEDTFAYGMITRVSDPCSSAEAIGQAIGDCCLNFIRAVSGSREAIQGGKPKLSPRHDVSPQNDYNAIGSFEPAAVVHTILNREVFEKCDTTCKELPPQLATHHALGGNVITFFDDSSGSDITGNGKPEISHIAKCIYITQSKGLPPVIGHGISSGKSRRKSRLKAVIAGTAYS